MKRTFKPKPNIGKKNSGKVQRRKYKLTRRHMKYTHKENLARFKGRTARTATLATAATIINERNAQAREAAAKHNANRTYRFGADIIQRHDQDVNADDQILQWVK